MGVGSVTFTLGEDVFAYVEVISWNNCKISVYGTGDMFGSASEFEWYSYSGQVVIQGNDFRVWSTACNCACGHVSIDEGVTSIASRFMFIQDYIGSLTSISIGKDVEYIGDEAFASLEGFSKVVDVLVEGKSVKTIGTGAFRNMHLVREIDFMGAPVSVGAYAFENCNSLVYVNLSTKLDMLRAGMFNNCYSLKAFNRSNCFMNIDDNCFDAGVFMNCNNLRVFTIYNPGLINLLADGALFAGVKLGAGCSLDSDGRLITIIRTNYPVARMRDWKTKDNRTPIINDIYDYFCVAHKGKWLKFKMFAGKEVDKSFNIFHGGYVCDVCLVDDNGGGKRNVVMADKGKWVYFDDN